LACSIRTIFQSRRHFFNSFSRDSARRVLEELVVHEPNHIVSARKPSAELQPMLADTSHEIVRDADIERAVLPARQKINVETCVSRQSRCILSVTRIEATSKPVNGQVQARSGA
jgi:hypothetical protein